MFLAFCVASSLQQGHLAMVRICLEPGIDRRHVWDGVGATRRMKVIESHKT